MAKQEVVVVAGMLKAAILLLEQSKQSGFEYLTAAVSVLCGFPASLGLADNLHQYPRAQLKATVHGITCTVVSMYSAALSGTVDVHKIQSVQNTLERAHGVLLSFTPVEAVAA